MAERKPLSKKIRFEVFKRDKFTCQYCGRSAPDVILHVDHIKPVAEGGDNSILNLITSCADCNLGKGKRKLSDASAVMKQKKSLEELEERRQQLAMMIDWKESLLQVEDDEVSRMEGYFIHLCGGGHMDKQLLRKELKKALKKYDTETILEAMNGASNYYCDSDSGRSAIFAIRKVCHVALETKKDPAKGYWYYAYNSLKMRFRYSNFSNDELIAVANRLVYDLGFTNEWAFERFKKVLWKKDPPLEDFGNPLNVLFRLLREEEEKWFL